MVSIEYIAGFLDGEGYIQINKARDKSHRGPRYFMHVSMCNVNRDVLDEIQKVTGGTVRYYNNHFKRSNGCGYHYRLNMGQRLGYDFLKKVLPYLIVKREQAEIAIRFKESLRVHGGGTPRSDKELEFQDKCYNDLKVRHGNKPILAATIA